MKILHSCSTSKRCEEQTEKSTSTFVERPLSQGLTFRGTSLRYLPESIRLFDCEVQKNDPAITWHDFNDCKVEIHSQGKQADCEVPCCGVHKKPHDTFQPIWKVPSTVKSQSTYLHETVSPLITEPHEVLPRFIPRKPRSKHCPFTALNGIRNCCAQHTNLDMRTAADPRFRALFEYRVENAGLCLIDDCLFCSNVGPNVITPQMLRSVANAVLPTNVVKLAYDPNPVDSILGAPGLTASLAQNLAQAANSNLTGNASAAAGAFAASGVSADVSNLATRLISLWDTVSAHLATGAQFATRHASSLSIAIVTLALWASSKVVGSAIELLNQLSQACQFLAAMGFTAFSTLSGLASQLLAYFSQRSMPNSNAGIDKRSADVHIESHVKSSQPSYRPSEPDGMCAILAAVFLMALPDTRKAGAASIALAISRATALASGLRTVKHGLAWLAKCLPNEIQQFLVLNAGFTVDIDIYDEYRDLLIEANAFNLRYKQEGARVLRDVHFCEKITKVYAILKEQIGRAHV